jgi:hypothetical protein
MAITKVLARDWNLFINTGTFAVPVWADVTGGINTFKFSNKKKDAETTDFASDGRDESFAASRSTEISAEGYYLEDLSNGDRNAGQELIEAQAELVGVTSLGDFKIVSPAGTLRRFYASVEMVDVGGGNDDPTSWGYTLTISGKPTLV